jgi:hypothetical protein
LGVEQKNGVEMKHWRSHLIKAFLLAFVSAASSCAGASTANGLSTKIVFVGSTPGDDLIKSSLAISPDKQIDFIRWDLTLNEAESGLKTYALNIVFGEGQPNTNGFKGGGEKIFLEGVFTVSKSRNREIYELKNERAQTTIQMVKLNENLFHLLTPDGQLMVGNGGWSYTLNKKDSRTNNFPVLDSWTSSLTDNKFGQVVYDGRTPCSDFARQYNLEVGNGCLKLKWRLTLFRDSKTNEPATYALQTTLNRPNITKGKWTIIKGTKANSEAITYQLSPNEPDKSISFLVGDENVLFFLDRENKLLTGNGDFSFTLNRRN